MIRWLGEYLARGAARSVRGAARNVRGFARFVRRLVQYRRMAGGDLLPEPKHFLPSLLDDTAETPVDATYFYQDAWAFERIVAATPRRHVDVGSHHKFVSLLSCVVPVIMVDIRPLPVTLPNLIFQHGSIVDLPFDDMSLESVSSICVIEHIGLGRYGDPLDPEGTEKAVAELKRVTAPEGNLYVSVPVDVDNRTYFDAHRAFTNEYLEELFAPFVIISRRYIYGREFISDVRPEFGTGCYHLRRPRL